MLEQKCKAFAHSNALMKLFNLVKISYLWKFFLFPYTISINSTNNRINFLEVLLPHIQLLSKIVLSELIYPTTENMVLVQFNWENWHHITSLLDLITTIPFICNSRMLRISSYFYVTNRLTCTKFKYIVTHCTMLNIFPQSQTTYFINYNNT